MVIIPKTRDYFNSKMAILFNYRCLARPEKRRAAFWLLDRFVLLCKHHGQNVDQRTQGMKLTFAVPVGVKGAVQGIAKLRRSDVLRQVVRHVGNGDAVPGIHIQILLQLCRSFSVDGFIIEEFNET